MKNSMEKDKEIICQNKDKEKIKVKASDLIWRPSVYGIIIEDNKVLLSKQWDGYDFPGGGLEIHETLEEGLKREFWEETGLEVEVGEVIHSQTDFFIPKFYDEAWNCVLIYYTCKRIGGELNMENFDENEKKYVDMPEWISLDDIDKIKFYNGIDSPKLIRKAVEKNK